MKHDDSTRRSYHHGNLREALVAAAVDMIGQRGLAGLANAKGQGRPAILQAADREQVEAAVRVNRQQIKEVVVALREELAKSFSPLTLKRFLNRVGANGGASATA